ncbi:MAG TPA: BON domain-containing protein [Burkholderiaceae bacterium]|nr:BON domain-containing protein [Burkholderiaceae bacterium]
MRVDGPIPPRRVRLGGRTLVPATLLACGSATCAGAPPPVVLEPPASAASTVPAEADRRNWFDDPFLVATHGLPGCPVPEGPLLSRAQMQHEAHWRAERGTSCFRSGRCRLPNAYAYDQEIAPRVVKSIDTAGQFADTSVWVMGQRRWVWLQGCVSTPAQAAELERIVRLVDDVEAVIPQLIVGTRMPPGTPVYRVDLPGAASTAMQAASGTR